MSREKISAVIDVAMVFVALSFCLRGIWLGFHAEFAEPSFYLLLSIIAKPERESE